MAELFVAHVAESAGAVATALGAALRGLGWLRGREGPLGGVGEGLSALGDVVGSLDVALGPGGGAVVGRAGVAALGVAALGARGARELEPRRAGDLVARHVGVANDSFGAHGSGGERTH